MGNRKRTVTGRLPLHACRGWLTSAAADYAYLLGHDERCVKAHAELANKLGILLLITSELAEELARTRTRDSAKIGHSFFARHANAVIANGNGARVFIVRNANRQLGVAFEQLRLVNSFE